MNDGIAFSSHYPATAGILERWRNLYAHMPRIRVCHEWELVLPFGRPISRRCSCGRISLGVASDVKMRITASYVTALLGGCYAAVELSITTVPRKLVTAATQSAVKDL